MLEQYKVILSAAKELVKAEEAVEKASNARGDLEAGSSRARVTTRNARLNSACEARDRIVHDLHVAVVRAAIAKPFEDSYYGEHRTGTGSYSVMTMRERP